MRKRVYGCLRIASILIAKQQRADRQQAVEPTARLVECLADEVGRKLLFEPLAIRMGVSPLRKRHGAGVVPAVNDLRYAAHPAAPHKGRVVGDGIDVRLVHAQVVRQLGLLPFGLLPHLQPRRAGFGQEFRVAGHRLHVARLVTHPDRQRRAPVALARQCPVDVGLEEISESPVANVFGQPANLAIVGEHPILELGRANEPALAGILDQGVVFCPPAERILVEVLLAHQQQARFAQLEYQILVRVFDPPSLVVRHFAGEAPVRAHRAEQRGTFMLLKPRLFGE